MRRQTPLFALVLTVASLPAAAHECSREIVRPYAIEKTCEDDGVACRVRMVYAPGENPGLAGHGSYWYPRAGRSVKILPRDTLPDCNRGPVRPGPHINEDSGENQKEGV